MQNYRFLLRTAVVGLRKRRAKSAGVLKKEAGRVAYVGDNVYLCGPIISKINHRRTSATRFLAELLCSMAKLTNY